MEPFSIYFVIGRLQYTMLLGSYKKFSSFIIKVYWRNEQFNRKLVMDQLLCFAKNHLFFNKSKSLREIVLVRIIKSPYIGINNTIFKMSEKRASDKSIYVER